MSTGNGNGNDGLPEGEIPVTPPDHPANARDGDPFDKGPRSGKPLADQADDQVEDDGGQFSLGILEGDAALKGVRDLVKRGLPVQFECSLMSAAVPARNIIDPETVTQLLVDVVPQTYRLVPDREPSEPGKPGRVKGWKVVVQMRPAFVQDAHSEAARAAFAEHEAARS